MKISVISCVNFYIPIAIGMIWNHSVADFHPLGPYRPTSCEHAQWEGKIDLGRPARIWYCTLRTVSPFVAKTRARFCSGRIDGKNCWEPHRLGKRQTLLSYQTRHRYRANRHRAAWQHHLPARRIPCLVPKKVLLDQSSRFPLQKYLRFQRHTLFGKLLAEGHVTLN